MFSKAFKMGSSTVHKIVAETCDVLLSELSCIYMQVPNAHEWKRIAKDYEAIWNFPNCVGAIDGKLINIKCPPISGDLYHKKATCLVLLASCDANYKFTYIDFGAYGLQSDSGVLWNSGLGPKLLNCGLDFPEEDFLPGTDMKFPYFLVGDAAFPLKKFLMRPYPGMLLPKDRETFNKRLAQVRQVIENAFGILTARWKILQSPLNMHPTYAENIVKTAVLLHNFVKTHDELYCLPEYVDQYQDDTVIYGLWREEIVNPLQRHGRMMANNATRSAFALRNTLKDYICAHSP